MLSIHALLAESDNILCVVSVQIGGFLSTLSLRRATICVLLTVLNHLFFLSTLSLRRATVDTSKDTIKATTFYPRSPCGERRPTFYDTEQHTSFYPRSPCGERRWKCFIQTAPQSFYPRSPCGERRNIGLTVTVPPTLSIHALLAESDSLWVVLVRRLHAFYPRSPCGERPPVGLDLVGQMDFLSTLSLRRATQRT